MPPDLEKKGVGEEIQMAHGPQLVSKAQICLVSAQLGAKERYIKQDKYIQISRAKCEWITIIRLLSHF